MTLPRLLDVSNYQPMVDWEGEKHNGLAAVYVEVGQGLEFTDPTARAQIAGARKARVPVGGYFYCTPGNGSGEQQADRLLSLAPRRVGDLRPCLDCETNPLALTQGQLGAWYVAAVTRIVARLGCFPTLYGPKDYLQMIALTAPLVLGRCPLWIADWGVPFPRLPSPWHSWAAWQWTESLPDPAVGGHAVDSSYIAELAALRIPARLEQARVKHAARPLTPKPWQLKPRP